MRYKNKAIINQRGGSVVIDNTTNQEKVHLSHRNGANIGLYDTVNSELAPNNKQINIVHDEYQTVGNNKNSFIGGDNITRVGENSYSLNGFISQGELDAYQEWKLIYAPVALANSEFKIKRGGESLPNGKSLEQEGSRSNNPVIGEDVYVVDNTFNGYSGVPVRYKNLDEVVNYSKVPDRGKTVGAKKKQITKENIEKSAGENGSKAPGVLEFGADKSASTEEGIWTTSQTNLRDLLLNIQDSLSAAESKMGNGGDSINLHKRNSFVTIGAIFNDYPSIRIDKYGRSQPLEMLVSETGAYKNHDYAPLIEEIDNSSNFPCGNDNKVIGNSWSRTVGSGGISLKTTGSFELGGTTVKIGGKQILINASHGLSIASEEFVEIQSLKSIILRSNRQVYAESSVGVKNNIIVGGGVYTEGELYVHHVTAPLEVQQTQDTLVLGQFRTDTDRSLVIGEVQVKGEWYPVYAKATNDLLFTYPHSHHFNNLPLRLTKSNSDVRKFAQNEKMNEHTNISQSLGVQHERKNALEID